MEVFKIIQGGSSEMITLRDIDGILFDIDISDIEEIQRQEDKCWLVTTDGRRIQIKTPCETVLSMIMRAKLCR
jgi:hypothetical protein